MLYFGVKSAQVVYSLSLYQLNEAFQSDAADFEVFLHGILGPILVFLQRSFTLFSPDDLSVVVCSYQASGVGVDREYGVVLKLDFMEQNVVSLPDSEPFA